ncbi:hypothetical protein KC347_g241 [Hortaea werneckii]|nr:hypothetical protein KC347_g241 [Hortaea werneckii]
MVTQPVVSFTLQGRGLRNATKCIEMSVQTRRCIQVLTSRSTPAGSATALLCPLETDELSIVLLRQEIHHTPVNGFQVYAMLMTVVQPSPRYLWELATPIKAFRC